MTFSMEAVGGRKFVLAMCALASATGLVGLGHISDAVYSAVTIATCGAYIGGNVVQKIKTQANP